MNEWHVRATKHARADLKKAQQSPYRTQLADILKTLKINPFAPGQSFEKLTPPAENKYSRRLNRQHRVVYVIDKETKTVIIQAAWEHYE